MMKSISYYNSILALWMYVIFADKNNISAFVPSVKPATTTTNKNTYLPVLRSEATKNPLSQLSAVQGVWKSFENFTKDRKNESPSTSPGAKFLNAINEKNIDEAMTFIIDTEEHNEEEGVKFEFEDTDFPNAWRSPEELERILRLRSGISGNPIIVIDEEIYDANAGKSGVAFHLEGGETSLTEKKKGAAFFELNDRGLIRKAFVVRENDKSGESSLKILKLASDIIGVTKKLKRGFAHSIVRIFFGFSIQIIALVDFARTIFQWMEPTRYETSNFGLCSRCGVR